MVRKLSLAKALAAIAPHVRLGFHPPGAGTELENYGRCAQTYLCVAYQQGTLIELALSSGNRDAMEAALSNLRAILDVAPDMHALVHTGVAAKNGQKALIFAARELAVFMKKFGGEPGELAKIEAKLDHLSRAYPVEWSELDAAKSKNYWFGLGRAEVLGLLDASLAAEHGATTHALRGAYKLLSWDVHNVQAPIHYWTDDDPPVLVARRNPEDLRDFLEGMATSFLAALLAQYLEAVTFTGPPKGAS